MWLVFMLAALLMLVGGVGGSVVLEKELLEVPPAVKENLGFIRDLVMTGGIGLSLLGVSLCYRKLRWVGRRRGGSGRSGRTRAMDFPKKNREAMVELEPMSDDAPPSEQATLLFSDPGGGDDEPGTRKMRKIGRR
ncbi:MAG: hypothetical protein ACYS9X_02470 [Planctomycetota bacterium]|jgi:hypothetical protein